MNALANGQLKRLRMLLARSPEIIFGRYTGETPQTRADGIAALHASLPDAAVLPNELLGREEMQDRPPHILLTNYAMLEYLLLRPAGSLLFEPSGDHGWRFIVLDEVHSYDGAMGLEIGMLLRRLRDRVGRAAGAVQAIATSATLGGFNDQPIVAKFAPDLFDLPFEWDDLDPARQDVIVATREAPGMPSAGHPVNLPAAIAESNGASAKALPFRWPSPDTLAVALAGTDDARAGSGGYLQPSRSDVRRGSGAAAIQPEGPGLGPAFLTRTVSYLRPRTGRCGCLPSRARRWRATGVPRASASLPRVW